MPVKLKWCTSIHDSTTDVERDQLLHKSVKDMFQPYLEGNVKVPTFTEAMHDFLGVPYDAASAIEQHGASDCLTPDFKAIIHEWTKESSGHDKQLYSAITKASYDKNRIHMKQLLSCEFLLVKALQQLPSYSEEDVFRVVDLDLGEEHPKGRVLVWWGPVSTTKSKKRLDELVHQNAARTIFHIKLTQCQAKDIQKYSAFPDEEEVLIPPGCRFRVVSNVKEMKTTHVHLEEVISEEYVIDMNPSDRRKMLTIGNPGAGKSSLMNCFARKLLFESGDSVTGFGVTDMLARRVHEKNVYMDTPGLSDLQLKKKAAAAISTALRVGGSFQIFFVITLESCRLRPDDVATIRLVLEACEDIEDDKYSIIVNKMDSQANIKKEAVLSAINGQLSLPMQTSPTKKIPLIKSIDRLCFVPLKAELMSANNKVVDLPKDVREFIGCAPVVTINPDRVLEIAIDEFERLQEMYSTAMANIQMTKKVGGASMLGLGVLSVFFMKQMRNNQGIANALQKEIEVQKAEKKQFEEEHKNKIKVLEEKAEEDEKERQLVAARFQTRIDDIETKACNKEKELEVKLQQVGDEMEARVKQFKAENEKLMEDLTAETSKTRKENEILQKADAEKQKEIKQEKNKAAQEAKQEKEKIIRDMTDLLNAMTRTATEDRSQREEEIRADLDTQVQKNNDKLDSLQQQQSAANLKIAGAMGVLATAGITYACL